MSNMDLRTIFDGADGGISESEAQEIKALLEANGISAVLANDTPLASIGVDVLVTGQDYSRAKQVIAEARAAGPAAAEAAQRDLEDRMK